MECEALKKWKRYEVGLVVRSLSNDEDRLHSKLPKKFILYSLLLRSGRKSLHCDILPAIHIWELQPLKTIFLVKVGWWEHDIMAFQKNILENLFMNVLLVCRQNLQMMFQLQLEINVKNTFLRRLLKYHRKHLTIK